MELFGIPLYDDDFLELLSRFAINFFFLACIVRIAYCKNPRSKDCLFTYFMINILVFFICFTLKNFDLGLGMALGLFAIFSTLRYRTDTIPIKEMTYLFMVMGVAVINALANKEMSYVELAFANCSIAGLAALLENIPLLRREIRKTILYEKIDLIHPEKSEELLADLRQRTGIKISRLELGQIDFLRDTVSIDLFYHAHEQDRAANAEGIEITLKT